MDDLTSNEAPVKLKILHTEAISYFCPKINFPKIISFKKNSIWIFPPKLYNFLNDSNDLILPQCAWEKCKTWEVNKEKILNFSSPFSKPWIFRTVAFDLSFAVIISFTICIPLQFYGLLCRVFFRYFVTNTITIFGLQFS